MAGCGAGGEGGALRATDVAGAADAEADGVAVAVGGTGGIVSLPLVIAEGSSSLEALGGGDALTFWLAPSRPRTATTMRSTPKTPTPTAAAHSQRRRRDPACEKDSLGGGAPPPTSRANIRPLSSEVDGPVALFAEFE